LFSARLGARDIDRMIPTPQVAELYRHLSKLREALKRELKIDTKTSKRKAA
jgi:hypothetical protein